MSSYAIADTAITVPIGRNHTQWFAWKVSATGVAIDMTGMVLTAELVWSETPHSLAAPSCPTPANGRFSVTWADGFTNDMPEGALTELRVKCVDGAGQEHFFVVPIDGAVVQ